MKTWVVLLSLAALAFAGCAEEAAPQQTGEQTETDQELVATEETGVIRGVVVDDAIVPIEGVTVTLQGVNLVATTKADGSFGFSDLDPGAYFMKATKPGYNSVQASDDVEAGVALPNVVRIQMKADPASTPYTSMKQFSGNLACGLATPAVGFGCSVVRGTEDLVNEYNGYAQQFEILPDHLQVEMYWKSTQPAGESLYLGIRHCCDNDQLGGGFAGSRGPSPQTVWINKTNMLAHEGGAVAEDGVEISTFPSGLDDLEEQGVRVGVIVDQKFDYYTTEFYNFFPDEGWTYLADGEHPLPK